MKDIFKYYLKHRFKNKNESQKLFWKIQVISIKIKTLISTYI